MFLESFDSEIIKDCLKGNATAQRLLYKQFAPKMLLVCLRYFRSREEAEDVLQEGFIIVFEKLNQFRGDGPFEAWVRKIMVNKSVEQLRKSSFMHPTVDFEEADYDFISAEEILSGIASKVLLSMIQELPPACRMVFNMYVFEGMKHKEIAEQLSVSENTSKSNLFDARAILKKKIMLDLNVLEKKIAMNER